MGFAIGVAVGLGIAFIVAEFGDRWRTATKRRVPCEICGQPAVCCKQNIRVTDAGVPRITSIDLCCDCFNESAELESDE